MAKSDEARGPRATWLYRNRLARYGRGDGGLNAIADALGARGVYRSPGTIRGWEADEDRAPIPPEILPHLEELFAEPAPAPRRDVTSADLAAAISAQAAAIDRQAAALERLATAIDRATTDVSGRVDDLAEAVGEMAGSLGLDPATLGNGPRDADAHERQT